MLSDQHVSSAAAVAARSATSNGNTEAVPEATSFRGQTSVLNTSTDMFSIIDIISPQFKHTVAEKVSK